jgi:arabinogalactan oligomer / maltooligosaccharide transport system permease protein
MSVGPPPEIIVAPSEGAEGGSDTGVFQGPSGTRRGLGGWFVNTGWRHVVALLMLVFALFPVYWVVVGSFDKSGSLSSQELVPSADDLGLQNYRTLFDTTDFWTWFRNSLVICLATGFFTVMLAAMAAFAFSRLRFRGRRAGLLTLLLIQLFPSSVAVVAIYVIMQKIGEVFPGIGLGTLAGLLLVYLGGAMGINAWLMKGFFDTIPTDLDESAKVDGATHFHIYRKVILPLALPILVVVFLISFLTTMNELVLAQNLLRGSEDSYTLAVGLSAFVNQGFESNWGPFAAGSLIGALPAVIVFFLSQRFIVSGLTAGAVKG